NCTGSRKLFELRSLMTTRFSCFATSLTTLNPWRDRVMAMPGVTFKEIQNAIINASKEPDLEEVLRCDMNERLDVITGAAKLGHRVFELIEWAEQHGREVELVQVTARARPGHLGMQQVYKKYGMAIPVYVERGGVGVQGAPADAADNGLEQ